MFKKIIIKFFFPIFKKNIFFFCYFFTELFKKLQFFEVEDETCVRRIRKGRRRMVGTRPGANYVAPGKNRNSKKDNGIDCAIPSITFPL
jgi:hypothetical protein